MLQSGSSVPTWSVTSRIHFDQEFACRHSEVRPVVRGSGRRITFTSRCQWQRAVSLFCRPGKFSPAAHTCTTDKKKKKEEEPIARLKQREKLRSKGKSCTKTNSCNPKVTVTDESSKAGRAEMTSLDWRLAKLCSLRAVEGRVHRRRYKPFGESDMHRLSKQGVPDRLIMATSGNTSFESTKIDSRRTPSTTVDGCLAGRRPPLRTSRKNLPSLSQTKWRSCENLSNRFSSFLAVHQMILATFKSVNNVQVAGACGNSNPSPRIWAGPVWICPVQPASSCWIAYVCSCRRARRWWLFLPAQLGVQAVDFGDKGEFPLR